MFQDDYGQASKDKSFANPLLLLFESKGMKYNFIKVALATCIFLSGCATGKYHSRLTLTDSETSQPIPHKDLTINHEVGLFFENWDDKKVYQNRTTDQSGKADFELYRVNEYGATLSINGISYHIPSEKIFLHSEIELGEKDVRKYEKHLKSLTVHIAVLQKSH